MFSINKRLKWEKSIGLFVVSIKKLEILQYDAFSEKYSFFLLCAVTAEMKMQKYLRRRVNWEMKNSWFNWKYIITLNNMVEENISQEFRLKKKKKIDKQEIICLTKQTKMIWWVISTKRFA